MAFVNEILTVEQREAFKIKGVENPVSSLHSTLIPSRWTIDHENDIYLIHAGVDKEFWNEHYFVFFYKGERHVVSLVQETVDPNTVVWKKEIQASTYVFSLTSDFVKYLRDALMAYKFDGRPVEKNENANVIIDF